MDSIKKYSDLFNDNVNRGILPIISNKYVLAIFNLLVLLYASKIAPQLPNSALKILDHFFVKMTIMFFILVTVQISPLTAIVITLAFLITMNYVNHGKLVEFLDNVQSEMATQQVALQQATNVMDKIENENTTFVPVENSNVFVPETTTTPIIADSGCLPHRTTDMSQVMSINTQDETHSSVAF